MGNVYLANTALLFPLQSASYLTTAATTITTSSWTATNSSVSITPKFTTSKILISVSGNVFGNSTWTIFRGGTQLVSPGWAGSNVYAAIWFSYIDAPGTTSSVTYTVYGKTNGVGTVYWGWPTYPTTVSIAVVEFGP